MMDIDYAAYQATRLFMRKKLPKNVKNILFVELSHVGDVISITPAIRAVRRKYPDAKISALVFPAMAEILTNNPNINDIIHYEDDFSDMLNKLKQKNFDIAIMLRPGSMKVSLLCLLSNIKYRLGCRKSGITEGKGFFLSRKVYPLSRVEHAVDENLRIVQNLNVKIEDRHLEIYPSKKDKDYINKFLKKNKIQKKDLLIAVHPGSKNIESIENPTHFWPRKRFAEVCDKLIKHYKAKIVITGAPNEVKTANEIASFMKSKPIIAAGKTTIKQFAALVENCKLMISIDTGAVHIANATNSVTIISLMGPHDPKIWRPYGNRHSYISKWDIVCTGCKRYSCPKKKNICMDLITVEDVLNLAHIKLDELGYKKPKNI